MFWMSPSKISQFTWHIFYVTFILGKFVMDALFSDFSSWQTTYPGICNFTVLESNICTHTVYEAIVENWHGMYCNDIIAHMHKTALIESPPASLCVFLFYDWSLKETSTHTCWYIQTCLKFMDRKSHQDFLCVLHTIEHCMHYVQFSSNARNKAGTSKHH